MSGNTRARIGGIVLLAAAFWLVGSQLASSVKSYRAQTGEETAWFEQRLAPVRPCLPLDAPVDYVSDMKLKGVEYTRGYYNARYVLSPVTLVYLRPCEQAVGNFVDAADVQRILDERGYAIERDFGNGVFLLRRRPR